MDSGVISNKWKTFLLVINCLILLTGQCGGPLILRLYFIKGGKIIRFTTFLQTVAWPLTLIPLTTSYIIRRRQKKKIDGDEKNISDRDTTKLILMKYPAFFASSGLGFLLSLGNYLYSYGMARLPVSTSSLTLSTELAFTALFAFLLVKQKFTGYSINAVVLLTLGAGILALEGGRNDIPVNEPKKVYVLGFIMTLVSAALGGLLFPLVELMYLKAKQAVTITLVLEIQVVMCFVATAVSAVNMIINNDFQAISQEAGEFELGRTYYYVVVVFIAMLNYCFLLGSVNVIFNASSLFSEIIIAIGLPITEVLAVIFYDEKFQTQKGISLALSVWGFVSFFYGEYKQKKKAKYKALKQLEGQTQKTEMDTSSIP